MSVYQLIKQLCHCLIKESEEDLQECSLNLVKYRNLAFELLLKNNFDATQDNEKLFEELEFAQFELALANRNKDAEALNQFVQNFKVTSEPNLDSIIMLLLALKNIDPDEQSLNHKTTKNFFKIPADFHQFNKRNVYLTAKSQSFIQLPSSTSTPSDECSFFSGILDSYTGSKNNKNLAMNLPKFKAIEPASPTPLTSRRMKSVFTWDNLESENKSGRVFSSESNSPIYLRLTSAKSKIPASIRTVSFVKLLNDVKLLTIGIESETFKRPSDPLSFEMVVNPCCKDISDLKQFMEEFLEAGTCFYRLKTFTSKNPFNLNFIFEGSIFKAFGECVIKFMNAYRDIVYSQEVETLLELSSNTRKLRKILIHLTKFLNIHPSSTVHTKLPVGSDFLGHLYNEYTTIFDGEIKSFFVNCLKSCCQIYLINFHKWVFHGHIDDQYKELFIYFVDHYRPNTKYFFDKAYLIRKQSVPGFLQGCAETILLCGKYTMLLKSFNQVHPLFMLNKPPFKVCLTNDDLTAIKAQCKAFSIEARTVCGKSVSIENIMLKRRQDKQDKLKKAEEASAKNIKLWRQEQEDRIREINLKREAQMEAIRKEMRKIEEKKLIKRMQEIQADRDLIDSAEQKDVERVAEENDEIQRRISVYEKLNSQLDEELTKRQEIVEKMKNILDSKDDDVNANESSQTTDEMNNIVPNKTLTEAQQNKLRVMSHEYQTEERNGNFADKAITEAQKNKLRVLSHEYNFNGGEIEQNGNEAPVEDKPLTEAQRNKLKVMAHEFSTDEVDIRIKSKDNAPLTEAQKNKRKVLAHDYSHEPVEQSVPTTENKNLSAAQMNKLKVLGHEFGMIDDKSTDSPKINVQTCESLSDLQRNRLKVLSHEFNIEKEVPKTLTLLQVDTPPHHLESPMSVTSDHFSSEPENPVNKSTDDEASEKARVACDEEEDAEKLEMIRAFEEAVEKNSSNFMGINLNDYSVQSTLSYEHIKTTDTMALSKFLQMSLMIPVNAYMTILNNETIKMFVEDLDILSHFKSLRNYFLMMNGEFSNGICHELFSKLESGMRPVELLNYSSLHMILDHALSRSRHDAFTENLSFIVHNIPDKFELYSPTALSMLTMSYKLEWPLTLILNPETMEQYQAIFNYLLKLKRISWVLNQSFQLLKDLGKRYGSDLLRSQQYRNAQQIRHKMTHFVHSLENHVTRNVLQISWHSFMEDLKTAQSIHGIYRKHTSYLKRILFLCLLNKKSYEFQKTIEDSFRVILKFHKHLKTRNWQAENGEYVHPHYRKIEDDGANFERLMKYVMYLGNKIIHAGYQKEIFDLLYLIDINNYYTNSDFHLVESSKQSNLSVKN